MLASALNPELFNWFWGDLDDGKGNVWRIVFGVGAAGALWILVRESYQRGRQDERLEADRRPPREDR